jgi:hypothetical protein
MKLRLPRVPRGLAAYSFRCLAGLFFAAAGLAHVPSCRAAGDAVLNEQAKFLTLLAAVSDDPDNDDARIALIRYADGMNVKPRIPLEAKKYFIKAMAIHIDAVSDEDFDKAARLYGQAIEAAPWWIQCYYNRAAALQSGKRFEEAGEARKFYLAVRAGPAPAPEEKPATVSGAADYSGSWGSGMDCWRYEFQIRGGGLTIIMRCWDFPRAIYGTGTVKGRTFSGSSPGGMTGSGVGTRSPIRFKGSINEDNTEIEISSILAPDLAETEAAINSAREQVRLYGTPEWQTQSWRRMSGE